VIAGHDWGAPVCMACRLAATPIAFAAVIGLSVPFRPRGPVAPTSIMPRHQDAMFYQLYFQQPGVAEAELERDVRETFVKMLGNRRVARPPAVRSGWCREEVALSRVGLAPRPCRRGSAKRYRLLRR